MAYSAYLSAPKLVLLAGVEQYARRYDWGPQALSDLAQFLVGHVCAAGRDGAWGGLRRELDAVVVGSEASTLRVLLARRLARLQTVDAFHGFFDGLRRLVVEAAEDGARGGALLLDSESVLGIFVRRCGLAFDQLEFHQLSRLFAECAQAAAALGAETADQQIAQASRAEIEEMVDQQIALLEAEAGAAAPADVERQIRRVAAQAAVGARAHYLEYLNCVRVGESARAEAALRRFFDSSAARDSRTTSQYALLHLAAMRAQAGMASGARQALAEATHVARDAQDHACLLFVACWETRLLLGDARADAASLAAAALVAKAAALGSREVLAAGRIYAADAASLAGGGTRRAFDAVLAARAVVVEHGVLGQEPAWWLSAARAWARHGAVRVAELHALLAAAGARGRRLAEREAVEQARLLALARAARRGAAAAATRVGAQLAHAAFANAARADDLRQLQLGLQDGEQRDGTNGRMKRERN
ncbi:APC5 protein [Coemansia thaxteri]|nr:APC5 protein [Coemansia thaxteri]